MAKLAVKISLGAAGGLTGLCLWIIVAFAQFGSAEIPILSHLSARFLYLTSSIFTVLGGVTSFTVLVPDLLPKSNCKPARDTASSSAKVPAVVGGSRSSVDEAYPTDLQPQDKRDEKSFAGHANRFLVVYARYLLRRLVPLAITAALLFPAYAVLHYVPEILAGTRKVDSLYSLLPKLRLLHLDIDPIPYQVAQWHLFLGVASQFAAPFAALLHCRLPRVYSLVSLLPSVALAVLLGVCVVAQPGNVLNELTLGWTGVWYNFIMLFHLGMALTAIRIRYDEVISKLVEKIQTQFSGVIMLIPETLILIGLAGGIAWRCSRPADDLQASVLLAVGAFLPVAYLIFTSMCQGLQAGPITAFLDSGVIKGPEAEDNCVLIFLNIVPMHQKTVSMLVAANSMLSLTLGLVLFGCNMLVHDYIWYPIHLWAFAQIDHYIPKSLARPLPCKAE